MKFRRVALVGVLTGAIIGGTTLAMAATGWDVTGTASATGTVASVQATTGSGTVDTALYPGSSSDCTIKFTNPNAVAVTINAITVKDVQAGGGTYTPAQYAGYVTFADYAAQSIVVPKNGSTTVTLGNCATGGSIPSNEQGASFTVDYTTDATTS